MLPRYFLPHEQTRHTASHSLRDSPGATGHDEHETRFHTKGKRVSEHQSYVSHQDLGPVSRREGLLDGGKYCFLDPDR